MDILLRGDSVGVIRVYLTAYFVSDAQIHEYISVKYFVVNIIQAVV